MESPLWTVGMGITSQCNMNCHFCYSQEQRKGDDLETDIWKSFIKNNSSSIRAINYGTGENTLSEAWYEIITYIRRKYPVIRQSLTTNGFLAKAIEESNKANIINECIDEVDVSIDFADPSHHDKMRGFKGAFDMALQTLAYCKDHDKLATIVVLGQDETLDCENLEQLFGLASKYDALVRINLYRHCNDKSSFCSPSLSTVLKAFDWIIKHHNVVSISEPFFKNVYGVLDDCDDDTYSVRILPNGDITPSTYLITKEWVAGNISDNIILAELLHTSAFMRFLKCVIPDKCKGCRYEKICGGGTRDRRFLMWGSLEDSDIYCSKDANGFISKEKDLNPRFLHGSKTIHSDYLPTNIFAPNSKGRNYDTGL